MFAPVPLPIVKFIVSVPWGISMQHIEVKLNKCTISQYVFQVEVVGSNAKFCLLLTLVKIMVNIMTLGL